MRPVGLVVLLAVSGLAVAAAGVARGETSRSAEAAASALVVYSDGPGPTSIPRLRLLDVDTGADRALRGTGFAHNAAWAPDGTRLVYEDYGSQQGNGSQLAVLALRSGKSHRITQSAALDESPSWSPDGRRIVFSRAPLAGSDDGLWSVSANGGGERHLTFNRFGDVCASWSPNGRRILFARSRDASGTRDLWLMRANGGSPHLLAPRASCSTWSPDGSRTAIAKLTGRRIPTCGCLATDLYLGDTNGAHRRLLVRNGGDASWSPDGSRLVFVRWTGGRTHLWVVDADGTNLRRLTGGSRSQRAPAWQP